jgi:hypothetical protein
MARTLEQAAVKELVIERMQDGSFLVSMLMEMYLRQTAEERSVGQASNENGVGWGRVDAPILTSFVQQVLEWGGTPPAKRRYKAPLSAKQLVICKNRLAKYSAQIWDIMEGHDRGAPMVAWEIY